MKVLLIVISSLNVQTSYETPSMKVCLMSKEIVASYAEEWNENVKMECVAYK